MDGKHEYLKVPEVAGVLRIARSRAYEPVAEVEIPLDQDRTQRQGESL